MSGGFRDTFTKDDQKDELLGYDDTAFYYFISSVLITIAVPMTLSMLYDIVWPGKAEQEKSFPKKTRSGSVYRYCQTSEMVDKTVVQRRSARRCTGGMACSFLGKVFLLAFMWGSFFLMVGQMGQEKEIRKFDPFVILDVSPLASQPDIKKAYRKLSLIWHPDKNPDDPLAQSRFIQITKAYNALTDEVARRNYEKYGNPDGPQTTKVGIGLPRFLLEKENHLMILGAFFFLLLFIVPMTFICYYQRTKNYAENGVMIETMQLLVSFVNEGTRVKNCPELLAVSAESRAMPRRPSDNTDMKPVAQAVVEHKKHQFQDPIVLRNQFLIWAHMQRLHHLMTPELLEDCNQLLKHSLKITQAMVEIACMREYFFTAKSMIEFRRCLVQALDVKASELLQIPHFNDDVLKHCARGKNAASSLAGYLAKDPDQRKGLSEMEANQIADIEAFCTHVSDVEMKAVCAVEDEPEIVVGDVATVTCQLLRRNLKENEAAGPVHAPFFPEAKFEEWWLFLVEGSPNTRIICSERLRDPERLVEAKLRFQVSRPGKHSLVLHALCDSYAGLDQKVELNFMAYQEHEVKREIFVHPEDVDLDQQPTLFQQFMGELGREEESEEEEEEGDKKRAKVKREAQALSGEGGDKADSDSEGEKDEKKEGRDDSASSDSSSDSD
mmetsp:Transcript_7145/g.15476  ORF Transcript_7145/g.15476 Transcript_7145/m.15476 type:complete len:666 (-) Transcript_7145:84-2081(-)